MATNDNDSNDAAAADQAAAGDHIRLLQKVNERLVIDAVEVQNLADHLEATLEQFPPPEAFTDPNPPADTRDEQLTKREDAVYLREKRASAREDETIKAEKARTASGQHMLILQKVNERLLIANIEAQKLAEQLHLTQDQMQVANREAHKANRAKSEFLSSMSHELRTPLNAILGFAQLLEAGKPPPTDIQMQRLQEIIKAGWYLLELINEVLDLSLIESGKLSFSLEPILLSDALDECMAMLDPQAQQQGIKVTLCPFDRTWQVTADHTRIKQVLVNLLSNAIKYNREQGTVEITCTSNTPGFIRIAFKDSGAGLPPEKLAQLFQAFNRLGQEHGMTEGTGIGLVVSKRLVELMGGIIGVESIVGQGSEFWVELPRDAVPQAEAVNLIAGQLGLHEGNGSQTLLYVEDNPANLLLVEQIIADHTPLRMLSAHNGKQGITMARTLSPDVILMDINLPGLGGLQALKILHQDPLTASIPIIALSANAMPRDVEKGLAAGFFHYLTKPIKVNELMGALDEALKVSKAVRELKPTTR